MKLFRKIRQRLLADNQIGRYLKYASGEVFLIVIGILIALSINNWNENQKIEKEIFNYLVNLREALKDDITSFEANISLNKTRLKGIFYILEYSGLNTQRFTELEWVDLSNNDNVSFLWEGPFPDSLNRKFLHLSFSMLGRGFGGISLNKSVINELYATGSFSHIQNADLKTQLGDYYSFLAQRLEGYAIEEHEEWANETTRFLRDKYNIFTLDISNVEDPIATLKGKKDVEHYLRYLALEVNYHCIWTAQAKDKAKDLVTLIEKEMGQLKK